MVSTEPYWVHTLNITMSNQLLMPREFVPSDLHF